MSLVKCIFERKMYSNFLWHLRYLTGRPGPDFQNGAVRGQSRSVRGLTERSRWQVKSRCTGKENDQCFTRKSVLTVDFFLREVPTVESLSLNLETILSTEVLSIVTNTLEKYFNLPTSGVTTRSNATHKTLKSGKSIKSDKKRSAIRNLRHPPPQKKTRTKQSLLLKQKWIPFKHN